VSSYDEERQRKENKVYYHINIDVGVSQ